jgi:hypothetical protein
MQGVVTSCKVWTSHAIGGHRRGRGLVSSVVGVARLSGAVGVHLVIDVEAIKPLGSPVLDRQWPVPTSAQCLKGQVVIENPHTVQNAEIQARAGGTSGRLGTGLDLRSLHSNRTLPQPPASTRFSAREPREPGHTRATRPGRQRSPEAS